MRGNLTRAEREQRVAEYRRQLDALNARSPIMAQAKALSDARKARHAARATRQAHLADFAVSQAREVAEAALREQAADVHWDQHAQDRLDRWLAWQRRA